MEEDDRGRLVAVEPDQDGTVPLALSQVSIQFMCAVNPPGLMACATGIERPASAKGADGRRSGLSSTFCSAY